MFIRNLILKILKVLKRINFEMGCLGQNFSIFEMVDFSEHLKMLDVPEMQILTAKHTKKFSQLTSFEMLQVFVRRAAIVKYPSFFFSFCKKKFFLVKFEMYSPNWFNPFRGGLYILNDNQVLNIF